MALAHRNEISDKELINHYEWMLAMGKISVGSAGWNRLEQLRARIAEHRKKMRLKYGKSYARVNGWTI